MRGRRAAAVGAREGVRCAGGRRGGGGTHFLSAPLIRSVVQGAIARAQAPQAPHHPALPSCCGVSALRSSRTHGNTQGRIQEPKLCRSRRLWCCSSRSRVHQVTAAGAARRVVSTGARCARLRLLPHGRSGPVTWAAAEHSRWSWNRAGGPAHATATVTPSMQPGTRVRIGGRLASARQV